MSDWLVSPPEETAWRLDPDELAERLLVRWPDAEIQRFTGDSLPFGALDFNVELSDGREGWGTLHGDGKAVGLHGAMPECAEPAVWLRGIVPAEQPLIFWDQAYQTVVELTPGMTVGELAAAVDEQSS